MEVNKVTKKLRLTPQESVKFQLITELVFFKQATLTPSELEILTDLTLEGEIELGAFCNKTAKKMYVITKMEEFGVKAQNVRNIISKMEKKEFITKTIGKGKKKIKLHPNIEVFYEKNVLLDYNFISQNV